MTALCLSRLDVKNPVLDHAAIRTTRCLHSLTGKKLHASESIERLQLSKSSVSRTSASNAALGRDEDSVSRGKTFDSTSTISNRSLTSGGQEKESKSDRNAVKRTLSMLIPQHVVDMGYAKKESFSRKQDQQRGFVGNEQRILRQKHRIPVLRLDSLRDDGADKCSKSFGSLGSKLEIQQKILDQQHCLRISESPSRWKKAITSGSSSRKSLLATAFDTFSSSNKVTNFNQEAGHVAPQHEQVVYMANENHSGTRGSSKEVCELTGQPCFQDKMQVDRRFKPTERTERFVGSQQFEQQDHTEGHFSRFQVRAETIGLRSHQEVEGVALESFARQVLLNGKDELTTKQYAGIQGGVTGSVSDHHTKSQHTGRGSLAAVKHIDHGRSSLRSQQETDVMSFDMENFLNSNQEQHQLFGEPSKPIKSHVSHHSVVTNRNPLLNHRIDSAGESCETSSMQSLNKKPLAGMGSQKQTNSVGFVKQQHTASYVGAMIDRFGQYASADSSSAESQQAAAMKAFDRNRSRKRVKNELREKDLSVQPIRGEQHYDYLIRRKQVRAEAQKAIVDDVDYKHVGDDWMKKRLGWLCKEIPVLKASGIVKMLNKQRKWIKQEQLKELIEHLVRYMELKRAHRVLKWMQQQPFYKFEYELHNNMAFILGRNDKLSRCQDIFDEIVRNGQFPDASVFTALIKAYLNKGDQGDINEAWKLYNQMLQLGLPISENLSETLLKSLTCLTGRWIQQAEELFVKMKSSGMYINEEMFSKIIVLYGKQGDRNKIDAMLDGLRSNQLKPTLDILNAKLEACVRDGDSVRAEGTLNEIVEMGLVPDWRSYANLIQVYGKANLPMQSWEIFEKMKGINLPINFVTYHSVIEAMASGGQNEKLVMQVLSEVEANGIKPLQPCYNSVMNMYLRLKNYDDVERIFNQGKAAKVRPGHAAYNMLMKAYTESGQLDKAEALFQEMKRTEGMGPNTHTYNILLASYGVGCFKARARELFEEMSAKGCHLDDDVREKVQSLLSVKKIAELEMKKLILTYEQREIIPGLLLGGARMVSLDKNRTYELHLEFNCENKVKKAIKDHLSFLFQAWWKPNQAGQSVVSVESDVSAEEGNALRSFVQLETVSHGSLRFYANQYRPDGEPIIPRLVHRWLKPRTLAYWYMYGGRKCQRTGGIILNASKYSGKEIQLVAKALKARTIDCRRRKLRNGDVIRFEGRSATWLWELMEPYILKTVKEQLKPEEFPIYLALAGAKNLDSQDQGSSHAGEVSSGDDDWEELEAEAMERLED